jgi:hypothetical protein
MTSKSNPVRILASGTLVRSGTPEELAAWDAAVDQLLREADYDPDRSGALGRLRDELTMILYSGGTAVQVADYFRALDTGGPASRGRSAAAFLGLSRALLAAVGRDPDASGAPSA